MDTKQSKITKVDETHRMMHALIDVLGMRYDIPSDDDILDDLQNAIGDYADAEIALHCLIKA